METEPQVVQPKFVKRRKSSPRIVKLKLNSKTAKYVLARAKGLNKKAASLEAGYTDSKNTTKIEKSKQYDVVVAHYKDALLGHLTIDDIAAEHVKNILQDSDRGAKNVAIKMALEKLEPGSPASDEDDKVLVILSS